LRSAPLFNLQEKTKHTHLFFFLHESDAYMQIQVTIVVSYVIMLLIIGTYAARLARQGRDGFLLAGRNLPTPLIAVTLTGLAIGGASTIGVAESAFRGQGLGAGWYAISWAISAFIIAFVSSVQFRKLNLATVPELFRRYFDHPGYIACIIVQVLMQLTITSLQYVAGGAILSQLLPDVFPNLYTGMIFSAIIFISLTFIGGLWSASLTNVLNVALIYAGIILAALYGVKSLGGLDSLVARLPEGLDYFSLVEGIGPLQIVVWIVVVSTANFSFQGALQVVFAARNGKAARNGFIIGATLMIPVGFMAALIGIAAKAASPDIADPRLALPTMITSLDPWIAGITLSALWAADVSTAIGLLLSSSTIVSKDIVASILKKTIGEKQQLLLNRIVVLIIGILTLFLALQITEILNALMIGLSLGAGLTTVILFAFFMPKFCRRSSAVWVLAVNVMVVVAWVLLPATHVTPHAIFSSWIACLIVFFIVFSLDKRKINIGAGLR
jgi:SSS family solute:Na+ symporter